MSIVGARWVNIKDKTGYAKLERLKENEDLQFFLGELVALFASNDVDFIPPWSSGALVFVYYQVLVY